MSVVYKCGCETCVCESNAEDEERWCCFGRYCDDCECEARRAVLVGPQAMLL